MSESIAIVGAACRYPDANNINELWENVLAGRRAFRRMPKQRINLDDYSPSYAPDSFYCTQAAVLDGYAFDRARFRIAGSTFRQADMAHWLALEVASDALVDAGFNGRRTLPRDRTGVLVGNTLTGEFSRARTMRLRWPYVRRVLEASLDALELPDAARADLLSDIETRYKAPFPAPDEESLAGGLANTIAGRICNYFDLHGGGYTVDGACASSLLAIANACSAIVAGDLDVAIVGGVDLSLDPFELVGFARNGALARDEMRIFDRRSQGFFPGEGCGFVVFMRTEEAIAKKHRIYATIAGWGISSDGAGGLTRPTVSGQRLALERAYQRAGFSARTVSYFEAHGTGTSVGDATELATIGQVVSAAAGELARPAAVGSIKALIGHTKAASGVAGLLKAMQVLHHRWIPATTGCETPHQLLAEGDAIRAVSAPEPWPSDAPLRAAVSGMGFGGINAHIVLEGRTTASRKSRSSLSVRQRRATRSAQDAELLAFDADSPEDLLAEITQLRDLAPSLSRAQIGDFGATLATRLQLRPHRAAVVASQASELSERLDTLIVHLRDGQEISQQDGVFAGVVETAPTVGFLFPGQGSPSHLTGGIYRHRFADSDQLYQRFGLSAELDGVETAVAQPAIVLASLAASRELQRLGVVPSVALGHSLGELSALCCGGMLSLEATIELATVRGRAMSELGHGDGSMAMLATDEAEATALIQDDDVVIACYNGKRNIVISGRDRDVEAVVARARGAGIEAVPLRVSHAFHSPLVHAAVAPLRTHLQQIDIRAPELQVVSTVTGQQITPTTDVHELLARQVADPVRFAQAIQLAAEHVDIFLEVGPGNSTARLAALNTDVPVISLDASGPSLRGFLAALAAVFVLGGEVDIEALFSDRFTRAAALDWVLNPLVNPCELAPERAATSAAVGTEVPASADHSSADHSTAGPSQAPDTSQYDELPPLEIVRTLVAQRAELSLSAVRDDDRMLKDLHLNSIMVAEIVTEAARAMGVSAPAAPTEFANATLSEMALAVAAGDAVDASEEEQRVAGVEDWVRVFAVTDEALPPWNEATVSAGPTPSSWQTVGDGLNALTAHLQRLQLGGWLVHSDDAHVALRAAKSALQSREPSHFVLIHSGAGPTGIARTLHLEAPWIHTTVIEAADLTQLSGPQLASEVMQTEGFREVIYRAGETFAPTLHWQRFDDDGEWNVGDGDVVLVSGGGKGITAECGLALAKATGVQLAILGRADPATDDELARNLQRLKTVTNVLYVRADVTSAAQVNSAVAAVRAQLGTIRGVLHGAGGNVPTLLGDMQEAAFERTLAVKVGGLAHILTAVAADDLRLLISFGSIIGRSGMRGEGHYAVANEQLRALTRAFDQQHEQCHCITMEWSVWAGTGMGERLGHIDALMRQGVHPIPIDRGVSLFLQLAKNAGQLPDALVISGRYGALPTLRFPQPTLPLLRFIDDVRIHTPGVELISDTTLSQSSDPFVSDHVFRGQVVVPGVMALEAMAQAALALTGNAQLPTFDDITFERPMIIPKDGSLVLRVAVLSNMDGSVQAVVRSADSDFRVDCVGATLRYHQQNADPADEDWAARHQPSSATERVATERVAAERVYGSLLFHEGRFRAIQTFRDVTPTSCVAEIATERQGNWFAPHLPSRLLLGDPAINDASIHAFQPCIPHRPLLPHSIGSIHRRAPGAAPHTIFVHQVERDGSGVVVDVTVADADGRPWQIWRALRLSTVAGAYYEGPWACEFIGNYLTHGVSEALGYPGMRAAVVNGASRHDAQARDEAIRRVAGSSASSRPDGRPELDDGRFLSLSYDRALTCITVAPSRVGCDIETVENRDESAWLSLVGDDGMALINLAKAELECSLSEAATLVWCCREALRKAGAGINASTQWLGRSADGWACFGANGMRVAATTLALANVERDVGIAIAVEPTGAPNAAADPEPPCQ